MWASEPPAQVMHRPRLLHRRRSLGHREHRAWCAVRTERDQRARDFLRITGGAEDPEATCRVYVGEEGAEIEADHHLAVGVLARVRQNRAPALEAMSGRVDRDSREDVIQQLPLGTLQASLRCFEQTRPA